MSATNKTTYYELPIFIGTDIPSWLGDWNNAMNAIDSAINSVKATADNATSTANSAVAKSDGNTESIEAMNEELQTLKEAVQNYDAILDFNLVTVVPAPNNVSGACILSQNTNKTLNKIAFDVLFKTPLSNPTTYVYTAESGTRTWWDLFTIEDNCFKLNQSSLPNYQNCLTLGFTYLWDAKSPREMATGATVRAWFDGATTHIGVDLGGTHTASTLPGTVIQGNFTVFISGSVYNPDPVA